MKVFLDAGHGGKDNGSSSNGRMEKNDVLNLTLKLGQLLKNKGIDVNFSRSSDVFIHLAQRTNDANTWGADLYLAIHRNSAEPSANGVESWVIHNASTSTMNFAKKLNNAAAQYFSKNRGVKKVTGGNPNADFHINREANMLSVLLEIGFITNYGDNRSFDNNIDNIAFSMANVVGNYFGIASSQQRPQPSPLPSDNQNTVIVKNGRWNLRAEPHINARIVGVLSGGTKLPYNGITPSGWYSIPNRGFIHRNAVTSSGSLPQPSPLPSGNQNTVIVKNGRWNLRAEPRNTARVVSVISGGTKLPYNGITPSGWYSIPNRGFIHRNALRV